MKTNTRARKLFAVFTFMGLLLTTGARAADTAAENVVRHFYAQLLGAMKQGDQLGFSGRYKKLDPAIRTAFNLPLMAKLSVGSGWADATPQEQSELVDAFSDFSVASYANRFAGYDGEQFTVVDEKPSANGVLVETTLQPKEGDAVALNYLMRPDDKGNYRIVDVFLNGTISELATQRSEFSSIVRRDGIPALVNSLGQKSKSMGPS
jgi:phospholipid transport system substrate-binding protein